MTNQNTGKIEEALKVGAETLELVARAQADKGVRSYSAALHAAACGIAFEKAIQGGLEPTRANMTALFHALYNHSAWRQKFTKMKLFPEAKGLHSSADLLAELSEEGV